MRVIFVIFNQDEPVRFEFSIRCVSCGVCTSKPAVDRSSAKADELLIVITTMARSSVNLVREFMKDSAERRVNPLEAHPDGSMRVGYKVFTEPVRFKLSPTPASQAVNTPQLSVQLSKAASHCRANGYDPVDRILLLSHVPVYLRYWDAEGKHDLFWLARQDPGFMVALYRDTVLDTPIFPRTSPITDDSAHLVAFKTLLMVSNI